MTLTVRERCACRAVFVDVSRNRSRRSCGSRVCGNRIHAAGHRARRAAAG